MYKTIILAFFCLLLSACIGSGINSGINPINETKTSNKIFPSLTATNLSGENLDLPTAFTGEWNLVIVAFKRQQQSDVDTWINSLPQIYTKLPNLNFYEVPVIPEGTALFRFTVNNGMRTGVTDPLARKRTITVFTDTEKFTRELGIANTDTIQAYLINKNGEILASETGTYSAEKADRIRAKIRNE